MALPFDPLTIRTCPHNAHGTVRPGSRTSHQTPPCCLRVADTFQERGGKPHADGVRGKNALKGPPKYGWDHCSSTQMLEGRRVSDVIP